jgi:hypothetical protein
MASGIQFYGIESVVAAYELNKVPNWGLFCGKQFQFKYDEGSDMAEGAEKLKAILTRLAEVKSSNTYTLTVYEELGSGEKIKNNTPFDGSFNFRLNEEDQYLASNGNYSKKLDERLKQIEDKLSPDTEEEEKSAGISGFLGSLLEKPEVQNYIFQKAFAFMDKIFPGDYSAPVPAAAIGKIETDADIVGRVQNSLRVLMEVDPDFVNTIEKVAAMAKNSPAKYNMLVKML